MACRFIQVFVSRLKVENSYNDPNIIRRQEADDNSIYKLIKSRKISIAIKVDYLQGMPPFLAQSLAQEIDGKDGEVEIEVLGYNKINDDITYAVQAWNRGSHIGSETEIKASDMVHFLDKCEEVRERVLCRKE